MARVLVVDDDAAIRDLFAAILEEEGGYEVVLAADGREALGRLAQAPVDAIICDINMPTMNGIELIRAVQADPRLRGTPIIVVSGTETPASMDPQLDIEVMVEKPFDIATLTASLVFVLGNTPALHQRVWIPHRHRALGGGPPGQLHA